MPHRLPAAQRIEDRVMRSVMACIHAGNLQGARALCERVTGRYSLASLHASDWLHDESLLDSDHHRFNKARAELWQPAGHAAAWVSVSLSYVLMAERGAA